MASLELETALTNLGCFVLDLLFQSGQSQCQRETILSLLLQVCLLFCHQALVLSLELGCLLTNVWLLAFLVQFVCAAGRLTEVSVRLSIVWCVL